MKIAAIALILIGILSTFFLMYNPTPVPSKPTGNEHPFQPNNSDQKTVIIATEEYAPFTSEKLIHFGIDCHIVRQCFLQQGIQVSFRFYPGTRSYSLAKNGDVDATLPWAQREGREKDFIFSDGVIAVDQDYFFFKEGFSFKWDKAHPDYSDIEGLRIAAISGHNYGLAFQKAEADKVIKVERISKLNQGFDLLQNDRVDLVISKKSVGLHHIFTCMPPEIRSTFQHQKIKLSPTTYDYLLVSKQSPRAQWIVQQFNQGLASLKKKGLYQAYLDKFHQGDYFIKNTSPPQVQVVTENWKPFSFEEDGLVRGSATKIVRQVLEKTQIPYSIGVYPWARAYDMARTKKNILIYAIVRTPLREPLFQWIGQVAPTDHCSFYKLKSRKDISVNSIDDAKRYSITTNRDSDKHQFLVDKGFKDIVLESNQALTIKLFLAKRIDILIIHDLNLIPLLKAFNVSEQQVERLMVAFESRPFMAFGKDASPTLVSRTKAAYTALQQEGKFGSFSTFATTEDTVSE